MSKTAHHSEADASEARPRRIFFWAGEEWRPRANVGKRLQWLNGGLSQERSNVRGWLEDVSGKFSTPATADEAFSQTPDRLHRFFGGGLTDLSLGIYRSLPPARVVDPAEALDALAPSFATVSDPTRGALLNRLLEPAGWYDEELSTWPEWNTRRGNVVLLVASAACHLGMLSVQGGRWLPTGHGLRLKERWRDILPAEDVRRNWDADRAEEFVRATDWAWSKLLEPRAFSLLQRLIEPALGWEHEELPEADDLPVVERRWFSLATVAAAAGLGALWFTGARWEPQLFGTFLGFHPDSPLR